MARQSITLANQNDEWLKQQISKEEFTSKSEAVNYLIKQARERDEYVEFVRSLDTEDALDVLKYLNSVMTDVSFSLSLKAYLKAPNPSFPQKLFFPKVLVLLAASNNPMKATLAPTMYSDHPALLKDPFYRQMGFK